MRVSIAMCTYNGASFLGEQLDSIGRQSRQPDELVIGDDCSTDRTAEIVARYAAEAPFPVLWQVNPRRLGSTANFEATAARCSGDLIAFCDQDDVWREDKLLAAELEFSSEPTLLARFTDAYLVDQGLRKTGERLWDKVGFNSALRERLAADLCDRDFLSRNYVTGATLVIRRKLLLQARPFCIANKDFLHDRWLGLAALAQRGLRAVPETSLFYRQHAGQQVGAERPLSPPSLGQRLAHLRQRFSNHDAAIELELQALRALDLRIGEIADCAFLANLHDRLRHLDWRLEAGSLSRRARLPHLIKELASGRYWRQSGGLAGAIKDFAR